MPAFRYEAVDDGGATRKGVVNADSAALGARRPARAGPDAAQRRSHRRPGRRQPAWPSAAASARRLSQVELALFTRQLASLLEAGLPLEQAFTALAGAGRAPLRARPDRLDPLRSDGRRLVLRRAVAPPARLRRDLPRAGRLGRTDRPPGARAVAPGRLHRAPQRAGAEGAPGVHSIRPSSPWSRSRS